MIVTPTNTGSAIAGATVGIFSWSLAVKGSEIPFLGRLYTPERRERLFAWMDGNKGLALLCLEAWNYSSHGLGDPNGVIFVLGNTLVNAVGLWIYLPVRQRRLSRIRTAALLQGERAL